MAVLPRDKRSGGSLGSELVPSAGQVSVSTAASALSIRPRCSPSTALWLDRATGPQTQSEQLAPCKRRHCCQADGSSTAGWPRAATSKGQTAAVIDSMGNPNDRHDAIGKTELVQRKRGGSPSVPQCCTASVAFYFSQRSKVIFSCCCFPQGATGDIYGWINMFSPATSICVLFYPAAAHLFLIKQSLECEAESSEWLHCFQLEQEMGRAGPWK